MPHPLAAAFAHLSAQLQTLINRLDHVLPPAPAPTDWSASAYRWRQQHGQGYLQAIHQPHHVALADLHNIEPQKQRLLANTRQFTHGRLANNALLTGARGCGKSSLVKAAWHALASEGLRLIEVEKEHLHATNFKYIGW